MARNLPQMTNKANGKLNKHSLQCLKDGLELQRTLARLPADRLGMAEGREPRQ